MRLDSIISKLQEYKENGCKGTLGVILSDSTKPYIINDIDYICDILESNTEGIILKAITVDEYLKLDDTDNITYGTVLKACITDKEDLDTVMLVNNTSEGNGFNCLVLDLITKEILIDCKDINDFKATYQIKKIIGQFNELFSLSEVIM